MPQKFVQEVVVLADLMDQMDYYQILRVDPRATLGQIRKAYHNQTRIYHPDRYFHLPESRFKEAVYKITKRITEAYTTLRDPQKRGFYNQQLVQTNRRVLRYTEHSEQKQKQQKQEEIGKTEQGRKAYQQGLVEMKRRNYPNAERAFKMALVYEPDNELFKQMRDEAVQQISTDYSIK